MNHPTVPRRHPPRAAVSAVLLATLGLLGTGCESGDANAFARPDPQEHAPFNRAMIQMLNNAAIDNAIVTQRTLHPYHFVAHSSELNDLGRRDLAVLGNHLRRHPGSINVQRAEAGESLYTSRLESVRRQLVEFGVDPDLIEIVDRLPDGDGDSSERIIQRRAAACTA